MALAILLATPGVVAAITVPGSIQAQGTLSHFRFYPSSGWALEGAVYEWTRVCSECLVRITITGGSWIYHDAVDGTIFLDPGVYELREFRGLFFGNDVAPFDYDVQVHGVAKVVEIPPDAR